VNWTVIKPSRGSLAALSKAIWSSSPNCGHFPASSEAIDTLLEQAGFATSSAGRDQTCHRKLRIGVAAPDLRPFGAVWHCSLLLVLSSLLVDHPFFHPSHSYPVRFSNACNLRRIASAAPLHVWYPPASKSSRTIRGLWALPLKPTTSANKVRLGCAHRAKWSAFPHPTQEQSRRMMIDGGIPKDIVSSVSDRPRLKIGRCLGHGGRSVFGRTSYIATLVERHTRYVMWLRWPVRTSQNGSSRRSSSRREATKQALWFIGVRSNMRAEIATLIDLGKSSSCSRGIRVGRSKDRITQLQVLASVKCFTTIYRNMSGLLFWRATRVMSGKNEN